MLQASVPALVYMLLTPHKHLGCDRYKRTAHVTSHATVDQAAPTDAPRQRTSSSIDFPATNSHPELMASWETFRWRDVLQIPCLEC